MSGHDPAQLALLDTGTMLQYLEGMLQQVMLLSHKREDLVTTHAQTRMTAAVLYPPLEMLSYACS
jgi:hypothetical protein